MLMYRKSIDLFSATSYTFFPDNELVYIFYFLLLYFQKFHHSIGEIFTYLFINIF